MKKNIAVVMGGYSLEYNISIKSGNNVVKTLDDNLYNIFRVIIAKNKWVYIDSFNKEYKINKDNFTLLINNNIINFDLVFMMIHGNPGENGVLQKYFENLGIHFTGPNSKTAELTFNKKKCIDYLASFSIKTARSFLLKKEENYNLKDIIRDLNFPMFIKANNSGSSLGVYKAYHEKDAKKYIKNIFKIDNEIIIERFINGREYSVGIINNGGEIQALGVTELISENDFFDYEAKYEGKHKDFTPAKIDMKLEYMLKNQAEEIYRILKIPGFSRIDFIVESNITYFLEINTIPGMTNQSIFPKQVELKNIKLKDLFTEIIQNKLK
jgi:D-alanine-D-alanine ligase|tara:strand:- start:27052 stop:28026 length:975 start_codon:yes stop_codon:yes gene_type:complete